MIKRKYLVVEAYAQVASYRLPEYHNYHKTLPLPPPTAVIGMVGAALGLAPPLVQKWFDERDIEIGIHGRYKGLFKDLWKIASTKEGVTSSILKREYLFENHYCFAFGTSEVDVFSLYEAFSASVYPLTAGNSDSLMKLKAVSILDEDDYIETQTIANAVVPGDYRSCTFALGDLEPNKTYKYSTIISPSTYNLPCAFDYDEDEIRKIRLRRAFTFIGTPVDLMDRGPMKALSYYDIAIPLFQIPKL